MATFIKTSTPKPTNANTIIRDAQFGIDSVLSGYIIQSVNVNSEGVYDDTFDQKNSLVSRLQLDTKYTANMEVIGGSAEDGSLNDLSVGQIDLTWAGQKWQVESIAFNGTYNDKKKYTLGIVRWEQFPGTIQP